MHGFALFAWRREHTPQAKPWREPLRLVRLSFGIVGGAKGVKFAGSQALSG